MRHLTEYTENSTYSQVQIEELASKMNVKLTISDGVNISDSIKISNEIASFVFICIDVDKRPGYHMNYYTLGKIIKRLPIGVGAKIIVDCNFKNEFKQGDVAVLTKDDGSSGWWAKFPNGVWNVGFGHDFFVISPAK